MKKKYIGKSLISVLTVLGLSLGSFFTYTLNPNEKKNISYQALKSSSRSLYDENKTININFDDLIKSYDGGFYEHGNVTSNNNSVLKGNKSVLENNNFSSFCISDGAPNDDEKNVIYKIWIDSNGQLNLKAFENFSDFFSNRELQKIENGDKKCYQKNIIKINKFNENSAVEGEPIIGWYTGGIHEKVEPTITTPITLNSNIDTFLVQINLISEKTIENNDKIGFYFKNNNSGKYVKAEPTSQWNFSKKIEKGHSKIYIEFFFIKDKNENSLKLLIPKTNYIEKGSWVVNKKFIEEKPVGIAFEEIESKKNDPLRFKEFVINNVVEWTPSFMFPFMGKFESQLNLNENENKIELKYNDFKYYFQRSSENLDSTLYHLIPTLFDTKGTVEDNLIKSTVLTGFNKGTYVSDVVWVFDKNKYSSLIGIEIIKDEIMKHLKNKPEIFDKSNIILNESDVAYDNAEGKLSFPIILNKYIDGNGILATSEGTEFRIITIDGFKKISPTTFKLNNKEWITTNNDQLASDQRTEVIKELVLNNKLEFFDGGFAADVYGEDYALTTDKICIEERINNNSKGTISIKASLTNQTYLTNPKALLPQKGEKLKFDFTIKGYKEAKQTTIKEEVYLSDIGLSNSLLASDQTTSSIKELIKRNPGWIIENLPNNFNWDGNDISIEILDKSNESNLSGNLIFNLTLRNFINENGNIITGVLTRKVTIHDFKIITPTRIVQDVVNLSDILNGSIASDQDSKTVKDLIIKKNINRFFAGSQLDSFNWSNDLIVEINNANNIDGILKIKLSLKKYYDKNGIFVDAQDNSEKFLKQTVTIEGFKKVKPTTFTNKVILSNVSNILATEIEETSLKKDIIQNNINLFFGNLPTDFKVEEDLKVTINNASNIAQSNNRDGYIEATFVVKNYFDDSGNHIKNKSFDEINNKKYSVTINGFRTINPTVINGGEFKVLNAQGVDVSEITDAMIQQIIFEHQYDENSGTIILGDLPDISPDKKFTANNIIITNVNRHPLSGQIQFNLNINLRFNQINGAIVKEEFSNSVEVILTGFKEMKPTEISPNSNIVVSGDLVNIYPQQLESIFLKIKNNHGSITPEETKIFNDFKKILLDEGFIGYKPNDIQYIVVDDITKVNNREGNLKVTFRLTKYMNIVGQIIDEPNGGLETSKNVFNFQRVNQTQVNYNNNEPFIITNPEYTILTVDQVVSKGDSFIKEIINDYDKQHETTPSKKIILGDLPNGFNYEDNLKIKGIQFNPYTSRITFDLQLNLYFNSQGIETTFPWTIPVKIALEGFEKVPSTLINNKEISPEYFFYPDQINRVSKTLEVDIQNNSTYKSMTASIFADMSASDSNSPDVIMGELLNSYFSYTSNYYDDKFNSLIVVYNPESKNSNLKLTFDAVVIQEINNVDGTITIRARARGIYFCQGQQKKIANNDYDFAYMNIKINNFVSQYVHEQNVSQPYWVIAILISVLVLSSCVFGSFLIVLFKNKKKKKSSNDFVLEDEND